MANPRKNFSRNSKRIEWAAWECLLRFDLSENLRHPSVIPVESVLMPY